MPINNQVKFWSIRKWIHYPRLPVQSSDACLGVRKVYEPIRLTQPYFPPLPHDEDYAAYRPQYSPRIRSPLVPPTTPLQQGCKSLSRHKPLQHLARSHERTIITRTRPLRIKGDQINKQTTPLQKIVKYYKIILFAFATKNFFSLHHVHRPYAIQTIMSDNKIPSLTNQLQKLTSERREGGYSPFTCWWEQLAERWKRSGVGRLVFWLNY